ncbi:MAG: L-ribulose-5-phosphate 3-epimerase [Spirochaetales bacterium]
MDNPLGIYEKALPRDMDWDTRFRAAAEAGYEFLELSIDETPERLARLGWERSERLAFVRSVQESGIRVPSMCLSGHRKFPFGSADPDLRRRAKEIMEAGILLASDLGIRVIQLAGYDAYYEPSTRDSRRRFLDGMREAVAFASRYQVMLAFEIMDTPFLNSISKYLLLKRELPSPWLAVYPDLGNLSAWGNDVEHELSIGIDHIVGVHIKETKPVSPDYPGAFRDIPFGEGSVDFVGCFAALKKLDYKGPFLIEMWTEKASNPLREIARARTWVLERLRQGGF